MWEQQQRVFVRACAGHGTVWVEQTRSLRAPRQLTTARAALRDPVPRFLAAVQGGSPGLSQGSWLASLPDVRPSPLSSGKGRGRQVIAVARTADVVIMMLDATKGEVQR